MVAQRCEPNIGINMLTRITLLSVNQKASWAVDLFNQYRQIAQDYKLKYPSKYERTKEDIDYIIDKKYADTPFGGMHNLHQSMSQVRVRVARIIQFDRLLKHEFDKFEMYYHALEKP